ncbi:hypothetical protein ACWGH2_24280 [Streptomyces sp. NPDC054871]
MVKSGSNSLKSRTRARVERTGATYQQAHGAGRTSTPERRCYIVQFLSHERHLQPSGVASQMAAAWADQGLEVLVVRRPVDRMPRFVTTGGRPRLESPSVEYGPRAPVLWTHPSGRGRLVEYRCPWADAASKSYGESPLRQAVAEMRRYFDVILLLDEAEFPAPRQSAETYVLIAYSDLPRTQTRLTATADGPRSEERALTPEQSAAILRDRQLHSVSQLPHPVTGVVCVSQEDPTAADAAFASAVAADMADSGFPIAGWVPKSARSHTFTSSAPGSWTPPDPAEGYHHAAAKLLHLPKTAPRARP